MKLLQTSTQTIASDGLQMTRMGIDASSMDMIMGFLRDKIYSDKILAPIREYCCNALDAMVEANNVIDTVKVKLDRVNDYYVWSVRDYGLGLSDDDITNIFGCYGASRKRHTNDQIGSYGIGSGSAFAYTDSFYITSCHQGKKSSYVCTLGKGDNGVSVGEIYKISEEYTTERGIEISFEVSSYDVSTFSSKTTALVRAYKPNAKLLFEDMYRNVTITPDTPLNSLSVGEYTISNYDSTFPTGGTYNYVIRMGGVCYPYTSSIPDIRSFSNIVVVDVPIGKLSIPISRESIENTPINDKVFSEIEIYLNELHAKEELGLETPKFGEVITGHFPMGGNYIGTWFKHAWKDTVYKTVKYSSITTRYKFDNRYPSMVSEGPTHVVYILPDIKNCKSWFTRVMNALKTINGDNYCGFVTIRNQDYHNMMAELDHTIDISDCVFVDVKKLKLPKLVTVPVDNPSYIVYDKYGWKQTTTADDLNKSVIDTHFNGAALGDDWFLDDTFLEVINYRTIAMVSEYGTRGAAYSTNSVKMYNALIELGWIDRNSAIYKNCMERLTTQKSHNHIVANLSTKINDLFFGGSCTELVLTHLKKNPEKFEKLVSKFEGIRDESSARGRILSGFRNFYYWNNPLHRSDIRQILKLKN